MKEKKAFNSHWYTKEKYVWDRKNREYQTVYSPDNCLFAQGVYSTKIKASDLPPYFIFCYLHRHWGWIDTKRIKDMVYKPNQHTSHLFKDDYLLISYTDGKRITPNADSPLGYEGYGECIWGQAIVEVVRAAKNHAGIDTSGIEREIIAKLKRLREKYPEIYGLEDGDAAYQLFAGNSPAAREERNEPQESD